ncbi:unnamed protein product [Pedinophyceae sp. YPF-701]|nr:unnamed protein product [Pedinophyceae sp. YPF-701]
MTVPARYEQAFGAEDGLVVEFHQMQTEEHTHPLGQHVCPVALVRPAVPPLHARGTALPAVVVLHPTGLGMESVAPLMRSYAKRGMIAAAIDCRYHGARGVEPPGGGTLREGYEAALVGAWRGAGPGAGERPFLLDSVWDIVHLMDLLETREDVDSARIGMTGISLGGMHTMLAMMLDDRVAVGAPMIGTQGFKWAIENEAYHARVASIPRVFEAAAVDMGKEQVDADVVRAVWNKILPGLLSDDGYDAPQVLPALAPRPVLVALGERDPRCPVSGLAAPVKAAQAAYAAAGCPGEFQAQVFPGIAHETCPEMYAAVEEWLAVHLGALPEAPQGQPKLDRWVTRLAGSGAGGMMGGYRDETAPQR